jgi:hypothetical protein
MADRFEYRTKIDNPLAVASAYHIEKLWREEERIQVSDLACAADPARTLRLPVLSRWAWNKLTAVWNGGTAGASRLIQVLLRQPAHR